MRTLRRLLAFLKPYVSGIFAAALLGVATILSSVGLMATSAYIIAKAALHPALYTLQLAITGVRFFGISRGVFRYFERLFAHNLTFKILGYIRVWFYEKLEPLVPAGLISYKSGEILSRIVSDIETLENLFVRVVYPPFVFLIILLIMAIFMGIWGKIFSIVLAGFLLSGALFVPGFAYLTARSKGRRLIRERGRLYTSIVDAVQGLADLIVFGYDRKQLEKVNSHGNAMIKIEKELGNLEGVQNGLLLIFSGFGALAVLIIAIHFHDLGKLRGVMIAVLSLAALTSFEAILPLPGAAQLLESTIEAGKRLFEIVDKKPAVIDPVNPSSPPERFDVKIDNLTFAYEIEPVLKNISLNVSEGGKVAVVGPSGAGKSTIANLLLRFWDYKSGSIRIGGVEIRDLKQETVRDLVSVMTQRTYLFTGTIRENILLARPNASDEDLIRAASIARIHDFIMSLPEGYDTFVGEHGGLLSGGERQRIALARIVLKGSPILILDEPTANLDAITERAILDDIFEALREKTIIFITHKLTHMHLMDEIFVLKSGRIVESGTHDELIAKKGLYYSMFTIQQQILDI